MSRDVNKFVGCSKEALHCLELRLVILGVNTLSTIATIDFPMIESHCLIYRQLFIPRRHFLAHLIRLCITRPSDSVIVILEIRL